MPRFREEPREEPPRRRVQRRRHSAVAAQDALHRAERADVGHVVELGQRVVVRDRLSGERVDRDGAKVGQTHVCAVRGRQASAPRVPVLVRIPVHGR